MLNLHPPFRRATPEDRDAVAALAGPGQALDGREIVVAEEEGRVVAVLAGRTSGDMWQVELLAAPEDRWAELGPRLLRLADALAAEDELGEVALRPDILQPGRRSLLEEEGFRPAEAAGGLVVRPVVPQG